MDKKTEDESVALPGAGGTEPTILEVLNRNIVSCDSGSELQPQSESSPGESKNHPPGESVDESSEVTQTDLRDSSPVADSAKQKQGATRGDEAANDSVDDPNVFEIESHLIETLENYSVSEQSDASGVEVKEVPPAKEELSKSSTIETETSPKTVIEVEPSQPKLYKSVKVEVGTPSQEPKVGFTGDSDEKKTPQSEQELEAPHIEATITENLGSNSSKTTLDESINSGVSVTSEPIFLETVTSSTETPNDSPHIEEFTEHVEDTRECAFEGGKCNNELNRIFEHSKSERFQNLGSEHVTKEVPVEKVECELIEVEESKQVDKTESEQKITSPEPDNFQELSSENLQESEKQVHDIIAQKPKTQSTKEAPIESVAETKEDSPQILEAKETADLIDGSPSNLKFNTKIDTTEEVTLDSLITAQNNKSIQKVTSPKDAVSIESKKITSEPQLGINGLPISTTESEEEAKKSFLDSIPQLNESDINSLSTQAKKEYYQSLREYLTKQDDRPPVPLQTYRWEDLRRAKQQGGYPWTHIYKRPLGPDEEPEIVLLLRKSQELQSFPSESPKSLKKVRIHDQVLVKETERYISDLSDTENTTAEEDTKSVQSESPSISASESEDKKGKKVSKLRGILKRGRSKLTTKLDLSPAKSDSGPEPGKTVESPKKSKCCPPIMDKLKIMADKQLKKRQIKKIPLKTDEKIVLSEEQKILKLKTSPKAERSEIAHFVEKQDSDEILEIVELEESPSKIRKHREELANEHAVRSILVPDEIIEIPLPLPDEKPGSTEEISHPTPEPTVSEILEEELKSTIPPPKAPRKRKEHVYEDIDNDQLGNKIDEILEEAVVGALKRSLATQDENIKRDLYVKPKLEEMGSSEEDQDKTITRLAPLSSIDSASSEEERKPALSPVAEESDQGSRDDLLDNKERTEVLKIIEEDEKEKHMETDEPELKSVLKRESSPNSDKKVTFSHVEDEAEPHREDIELPEHIKLGESRWSKIR